MVRRRAMAAAGGLLASLFTVMSGAASQADPVLTVPETPSGDVVVTAQADPVAWPYLQVKLARPTDVVAPYEEIDAIDPAPFINTGASSEMTVPAWGLSGAATFLLLGCLAPDSETCSTLLASVDRTVTSVPGVTAGIDAPEDVVFASEEPVTVTVDNPGGGRVRISFFDTVNGRTITDVGDHSTTSFDAYPGAYGYGPFSVRLCSTFTDNLGYCRTITSRSLDYVKDAYVDIHTGGNDTLTVDPEWTASSQPWNVWVGNTYVAPYDLSWDLFDAEGNHVVGPVEVATGQLESYVGFRFDPGVQANVPLPDGSYTAVVTSRIPRGELTKTGSDLVAVNLVNDPPADHPHVLKARRLIRPGTVWGSGEAYFEVESLSGSTRPGKLRRRSSKGVLVKTMSLANPCSSVTVATCGPWRLNIDRYGDNVSPLKPGNYSAELVMPDTYGRMMVKPLGKVEVQRLKAVAKAVSATASRAWAGDLGAVGRCSSVSRPGVRGWRQSLGLLSLSRCDSRRGDADVVRQGFELRMPGAAGYETTLSVSPELYTGARNPSQWATTSRRIPRLDRRWERGIDLGDGVGRQPAGGFNLPWHVDLRGAKVQVRVSIANGIRYDVGRFRVHVDYLVWRTPQG
jgi:hypothetical protein